MNDFILNAMIAVAKLLFPKYAAIPNKIIIGQAHLETARYTSNIYKEGNNLFGMKKPSKRKFWGIGEVRGHAKYATWLHSVLDYFERVHAFKNTYQLYKDDYYTFLEKTGYAEPQKAGTPTYIDRLKSVVNKLPDYNTVTPLIGIAGFFLSSTNWL